MSEFKFDPKHRGEIPEKKLFPGERIEKRSYQAKTTKHTLPSKGHLNQPPTK